MGEQCCNQYSFCVIVRVWTARNERAATVYTSQGPQYQFLPRCHSGPEYQHNTLRHTCPQCEHIPLTPTWSQVVAQSSGDCKDLAGKRNHRYQNRPPHLCQGHGLDTALGSSPSKDIIMVPGGKRAMNFFNIPLVNVFISREALQKYYCVSH